jgi:hypothetical protein
MHSIIPLTFIGTLLLSSTALAAEPHRWIGTQFDVGFPAGGALAMVFRPFNWARFHVAETYNTMSAGFRGGLTLDPLDLPGGPSLTVEGGWLSKGKLPGVTMPAIGGEYISLLLGLEFGKRDMWRLFVQGGPTWAHLDVSMNSKFNSGNVTYGTPNVNVMVPGLKIGFTYYFK